MKAKKPSNDLSDPAVTFSDPSEIVLSETLTPSEKLSFLEDWKRDLVRRQESDAEGMAPEAPGAGEKDAALIRFVENAIRTVGPESAD